MSVSLRPDPSKGVFETMLVLDGHPVELEAHLERLAVSIGELYEELLPPRMRETAIGGAAGLRHGKLRVTVINSAGELRTHVATEEVDPAAVFPAPERGAALHSVVVDAGLGAHKWADRRLLERAAAAIPAGRLPLLIDRDGTVLEVSRASVFSVRDGAIATPPLDGRILPSIARRQALEVARADGVEAREERLTLGELRGSDEVFLSGSVRGIEPVASIDRTELPDGGELSSRVADALRHRWLGPARAEPVAAGAGARPGGRPGR